MYLTLNTLKSQPQLNSAVISKMMMKGLIVLAVIAVGSALPIDSDFDSQWDAFKTFHGKKYAASEDDLRRLIWEENLKRVALHNLEASIGKHTYTLAMNEFADLSGEEFSKIVLGSCIIQKRNGTGATFLKSEYIQVPAAVDWREKNLVTPMKDQKQCGSCWAFSTTGSLEGQHAKKTGKLVSLSEQQLVDCAGKFGNFGCNGGLMDNAFKYITANGGIDTEISYPYEARDGHCRFNKATIGATVAGFSDIPEGDEDALTQAIAAVGPISVAIDASHFSFQLYHAGVYYERRCSSTRLDHGVLAVGYGTEDGEDFFLVKNSWGLSWGQKGYINMARNRKNNCGIATSASYPLV